MTLSILTLNLWHNAGPWEKRRLLIRDWIERLDPDVIAFQEALRSVDFDQTSELLGEGRYHVDYVHGSPFWQGQEYSFGNAVASRWPIAKRRELKLPDRGDGETRAAISVEIDAPFGPLSFTCTHLHWRFHHGATREKQVVALCQQVLDSRRPGGFPPIIAGDFNAEPDSDEIRFMTGGHSIAGSSVYFHDAWRVAGEGGDGITWSNRNVYARPNLEPDRRLDYIFTGYPLKGGIGLLERCSVVCNEEQAGVWPSDHFGVFAELRTEVVPDPSSAPADKG
jgi:endonuclease/exonuclease/phosphatase family metal-dependent hydrolase